MGRFWRTTRIGGSADPGGRVSFVGLRMGAVAYSESFGDPGHEPLYRQLRASGVPLLTHAYRNAELFPSDRVDVVPLTSGLIDFLAAGVRRLKTHHPYRLALSVELRLMDRMLQRSATAIHAYGGADGARIAPVARRLGCRLIATLRDTDVSEVSSAYGKALRDLFDASARILATAPAVEERLLELGCPAEKLELLPFGVPLRPMRPLRVVNGTVKVISVADLRPVNGMAELVDAVALARRMGAKLVLDIVGDGADRAKVQAAIERSQLSGHIRMHGTLLPHETRALLDNADVFVLNRRASDEQEVPPAILEAMVSGLCVVATREDSLRQVVRPDVTGVLLDKPDTNSLAGALVEVARDAGTRVALGAAGRAKVERDFDLAHTVERLRELYQ